MFKKAGKLQTLILCYTKLQHFNKYLMFTQVLSLFSIGFLRSKNLAVI